MAKKKPRKSTKKATPKKNTVASEKERNDPKYFDSEKSKDALGLKNQFLTPFQRKQKEEIFQRRKEVAKLMTEYGYNDITIAGILGVNKVTISTDREWLHNLWLQEVVTNMDLAKAKLAKRKQFVMEEARMAWEKSKGDKIKTQKRERKKEGGKQGGETEKETAETVENNVGDAEYLRIFAKAADDLAELEGFKSDNITTQINITMPSLPSDFKKYGLKEGLDPDEEVEEVETEEDKALPEHKEDPYGVDIQVLEEDEVRRRQKSRK